LLDGFAFINPTRLRNRCDAALRHWDVRFASTSQRAGSLSGGNAQKVILSREIDDDARFVIAAQPTRGLDIGASAFVWRALRAIRDRGHAVLLISSDLDELFDISDRIVVIASGHIVAEFQPPYRLSEIGAAMTGAST
jgi:simple sugar transport system ATP-binding protein